MTFGAFGRLEISNLKPQILNFKPQITNEMSQHK